MTTSIACEDSRWRVMSWPSRTRKVEFVRSDVKLLRTRNERRDQLPKTDRMFSRRSLLVRTSCKTRLSSAAKPRFFLSNGIIRSHGCWCIGKRDLQQSALNRPCGKKQHGDTLGGIGNLNHLPRTTTVVQPQSFSLRTPQRYHASTFATFCSTLP